MKHDFKIPHKTELPFPVELYHKAFLLLCLLTLCNYYVSLLAEHVRIQFD